MSAVRYIGMNPLEVDNFIAEQGGISALQMRLSRLFKEITGVEANVSFVHARATDGEPLGQYLRFGVNDPQVRLHAVAQFALALKNHPNGALAKALPADVAVTVEYVKPVVVPMVIRAA